MLRASRGAERSKPFARGELHRIAVIDRAPPTKASLLGR